MLPLRFTSVLGGAVHARLTLAEVAPENVDRNVRYGEGLVAQWKQLDGYRGMTYLIDRATGKVAALTFWDSEDALAAAEETMNRLRGQWKQDFTPTTPPNTQHYEVALSELPAG